MIRGLVAVAGFVLAGCVETLGAPAQAAQLLVDVEGTKITMRGREMADVQALQTALMAESTFSTVITVKTHGQVDDAALWGAVSEASKAPASRIDLRLGGLALSVSSRLDLLATKAGRSYWGWVRRGQLNLHFESQEMIVPVGDTAAIARARAALDSACPAKDCHATLSVGSDEPLIPALDTWRRVFAHGSQMLSLDRVHEEDQSPEGAPKPDWSKGRLEPEVIQRAIRLQYPEVRRCYESGLARNTRLLGLMVVRFVIDRDGVATRVEDWGSNLPDLEVRKCIFGQFQKLRFPPPAGGVVTVVYPIVLMPG